MINSSHTAWSVNYPTVDHPRSPPEGPQATAAGPHQGAARARSRPAIPRADVAQSHAGGVDSPRDRGARAGCRRDADRCRLLASPRASERGRRRAARRRSHASTTAGSPPEDIAERARLDLYGAALAHFDLRARARAGDARRSASTTPSSRSHGWESPHTAVEIVTDDMPFLIDSVGMELNRRGFGVHLIIHPVIQVRRDGEGKLLEVLPHGAERRGRARRVGDPRGGRPPDRPGRARAARGPPRCA